MGTADKHDSRALLREARESVYLHKERLIDCPHELDDCTCDLAAQKVELLYRIDAALEQKTVVTELTEHQREWIVRIARAAVMWGSRAGSLYTIGRDSPNPESFTAMELANRAFAEIGIEGRFTMPAPTPPRKARGAK